MIKNPLRTTILTLGASICILINCWTINRWKFLKIDKRHIICSVVLFSISAFSLNLSMPIFHEFSAWTEVYLVVMFVPLFVICFFEEMPQFLRIISSFVMGAGIIMSFYFTMFLLPYVHIGLLAFFLFGLSLHLLAPLFLLLTYAVQFIKLRRDLADSISFSAGVLLPILMVLVFLMKWKETRQLVN